MFLKFCLLEAYYKTYSHLLLLHGVFGAHYLSSFHIDYLTETKQEVTLYVDLAFDEYCKLELPIPHKEKLWNSSFRVVGISNGFVCLLDDLSFYPYNFIIWNPIIRKWPFLNLILPSRSVVDMMLLLVSGIMLLSTTIKFVRFVNLLDQQWRPNVPEVYSLATGSWRSLCLVAPRL